MMSLYQPQKELGLFRLNDNAEKYLIREEGCFEVRFEDQVNLFNTLVGAFLFYLTVEQEVAIYDITDGKLVLIEIKRHLN